MLICITEPASCSLGCMSIIIGVGFFECVGPCVALVVRRFKKPDRLDEMERVEGAGGWIVDWHGHRVLGVLATSRSLGDYGLKPYVISKPELMVIDHTEEDDFLILASDGLWRCHFQ